MDAGENLTAEKQNTSEEKTYQVALRKDLNRI